MKRIIAISGIVILVLLYVITLIAAVTDSTARMDFFRASVAATILIPVLLYIYIGVYKWVHKNDTDKKDGE